MCGVEKKVLFVDFPSNVFLRLGKVDNLQTVRIKKQHPQSAQESPKHNISNWLF